MQAYCENSAVEAGLFRASVTGVPVKFGDKGFGNFNPRESVWMTFQHSKNTA